MPWLVAAFAAMLFLVPFVAITLPVSIPVDSKPDRFVVVGMLVAWLAVSLARPTWTSKLPRSPMNWAILAFVVIAGVSVAINVPALAHEYELGLALKKVLLLGSYIALFFIVATSVRPSEVPAFATLIIGLAAVMAVGMIIEYRTGVNYFYDLARQLLPGASVAPPPLVPGGAFARPAVVGPTTHGLAACTLLSFALPFIGVRYLAANTTWRRVAYVLVGALLLAAALATGRKTAVILPLVTGVTLLAARPRVLLRQWPVAVILVVVVQIAAPSAISNVRYQFDTAPSQGTTRDRTSDYAGVWPDIKSHLAFGRGFGTYEPPKYRFLDNEMLLITIEVGFVGALAYVALLAGAAFSVRRIFRSRDPVTADLALAVVAASTLFFVSNFLYDAFSFRQAPYAFFLIAALGVALASGSAAKPADHQPSDASTAPGSRVGPR